MFPQSRSGGDSGQPGAHQSNWLEVGEGKESKYPVDELRGQIFQTHIVNPQSLQSLQFKRFFCRASSFWQVVRQRLPTIVAVIIQTSFSRAVDTNHSVDSTDHTTLFIKPLSSSFVLVCCIGLLFRFVFWQLLRQGLQTILWPLNPNFRLLNHRVLNPKHWSGYPNIGTLFHWKLSHSSSFSENIFLTPGGP